MTPTFLSLLTEQNPQFSGGFLSSEPALHFNRTVKKGKKVSDIPVPIGVMSLTKLSLGGNNF
jgi:hypothetical protein